MTLTVAWVRTVGRHAEMVFASDSRLSQGGKWDACPKVFALPRTDALLGIAGSTFWAYPFAMQIVNTIGAWAPSRNHQRDLRELPRHLRSMINSMVGQGDTFTGGYNEPLTELLLGGWSWQARGFKLWRFHYVQTDASFRHATITAKPAGLWKFIGDHDPDDDAKNVVPHAEQRLRSVLEARGKWCGGALDMEPLEVLIEVIRDERFHTVGGPPQVAKVYQHMNTQRFVVPWPRSGGQATYGGRILLEHEGLNLPEIDPDRPDLHARTRRVEEASRMRGAADLESLLLNAIEDAGSLAADELNETVAEQEADTDVGQVSRWLEGAAARGLVRRTEEGRWQLADADVEE